MKKKKKQKGQLASQLAHKLFPDGQRPTLVHRDKRKERGSKQYKKELAREITEF